MEHEVGGDELELAGLLGTRARFGVRRALLVNIQGSVRRHV